MFVIHRVDVADSAVRAGLDSLISECFVPSDWQHERLPKAKTGYWWTAFEGKVPVAFACMRPSVRWVDTGYLSISGVLKPWRGKGLQKRLIRARVRFARTLGWHTVISDTLHDNAGSMRSLLACGFKPYIPTVRWGSKDEIVYFICSTEPRLSAA